MQIMRLIPPALDRVKTVLEKSYTSITYLWCWLLVACAASDTSLVTEEARRAAVPTWVTTTEGDRIQMPFAVEDGHSIDDYREFLFPSDGAILRITFLGHGFTVGDGKVTLDAIILTRGKPVCLLLKTKVGSVSFVLPAMGVEEALTPGVTVPTWFGYDPGVYTMGIGKLDPDGEVVSALPYGKLIMK